MGANREGDGNLPSVIRDGGDVDADNKSVSEQVMLMREGFLQSVSEDARTQQHRVHILRNVVM